MKSIDKFQEICNKYAFEFYECGKVHGKTIGGNISNSPHFHETQLNIFMANKEVQQIIRQELFPNSNNGRYGIDPRITVITPFNKLVFNGWLEKQHFFEMEIHDLEK